MPERSTPSECGNWPARAHICPPQKSRPSASRAPRPRIPLSPTLPAESPHPARLEFRSAHRPPPARGPRPSILFHLLQRRENRETQLGSTVRTFSWFLVKQEFSGNLV